jgi:hypothetical protein
MAQAEISDKKDISMAIAQPLGRALNFLIKWNP